MTLSDKSVSRPVTVLIAFVLLVGLGLYSIHNLSIDVYPEIKEPVLSIITNYPNAGPADVEESVTKILESSLSGVSGLKRIESMSAVGSSYISMKFSYSKNLDDAVNDCREKIDVVRNELPKNVKTPVIFKTDPSMSSIISLGLRGNRSADELGKIVKKIQPKLLQIEGVAAVTIAGDLEKCVKVDVSHNLLEAYNITISEIAQNIGLQNIQSSGGFITNGDINYSIQSDGKLNTLEDVKNIVVARKTEESGNEILSKRVVRLMDIAEVYEGYKKSTSLAYVNGEPCIELAVSRQSGKNTVETSKQVRKQVEIIKQSLPNDVELFEIWNDTDSIKAIINAVISAVIEGAVLAIIVLFVFLRSFRSTIVVGISIPVSLIITMFFMLLRKMTVNMLSLAGLLIGVGMLVDNAIVVLENIYSHRQNGESIKEAAINGADEMIGAITSSTLTTVCIFIPMILLKDKMGMMGQLLKDLSLTIVFSLLCSLVVAICLVPVMTTNVCVIKDFAKPNRLKFVRNIKHVLEEMFVRLKKGYLIVLKAVFNRKKAFLLSISGLFIASILVVMKIGFIFIPETEQTMINLSVVMPKGTKLDVTDSVVRGLEEIISSEIKGVKFISSTVGDTEINGSSANTNKASVMICLYDKRHRQNGWDNAASAKKKIFPYFKKIPGASIAFVKSNENMSSGLIIEVQCDDLKTLASTTKSIENLLKEEGEGFLTGVKSNLGDGFPQIKIIFDRDMMYDFGLNADAVSSEIRANIDGVVATRYEISGTEVDMILSLREKDKSKMTDLTRIFVTNNEGFSIPVSNFAHLEESVSPESILRKDQKRMTQITCNPKDNISLYEVQKKITALTDGNIVPNDDVTITFSGDSENLEENGNGFLVIIVMAASLVFAIMASQFESIKDPFIVIFTIPLSFIGVALVYLITGQQLSLVSVFGFVMLVGMIVNNGIVLVDYTNFLRRKGTELKEACFMAAESRFRPILMSTLTTIISLVPMSFSPSEGTEIIQPISLTVLGGLSFGSLMTLFVMPCIYFIFNRKSAMKGV